MRCAMLCHYRRIVVSLADSEAVQRVGCSLAIAVSAAETNKPTYRVDDNLLGFSSIPTSELQTGLPFFQGSFDEACEKWPWQPTDASSLLQL